MKIKCVACGLVHYKSQRLSHPEIKQSLCPKCWCGGFTKDVEDDNNNHQAG